MADRSDRLALTGALENSVDNNNRISVPVLGIGTHELQHALRAVRHHRTVYHQERNAVHYPVLRNTSHPIERNQANGAVPKLWSEIRGDQRLASRSSRVRSRFSELKGIA